MSYQLALLAIVVALAFYVVSVYNWLQTTLTRISASIQEIGNQLKRQANLIPNLETAAKAYLKHEKDIYKSLTDARKANDTTPIGLAFKSLKLIAFSNAILFCIRRTS